MKKLVSLLVVLCLLLGGVALAEEESTQITQDDKETPVCLTTVSLVVDQTYTVTIPSTVNLTMANTASNRLKKDVTVSNLLIAKGAKLVVTLNSIGSMDNGKTAPTVSTASGAELSYSIYKGNTGTDTYGQQEEVARTAENGTYSLYFALNDTPKYSGTYTDTITFRVMVSYTTGPGDNVPGGGGGASID